MCDDVTTARRFFVVRCVARVRALRWLLLISDLSALSTFDLGFSTPVAFQAAAGL